MSAQRTYGGSGRHAIPAVRIDDRELIGRVAGSRDDVRKVLARNGVEAAWMDSLMVNPSYTGRHRAEVNR